MRTMRTGSIVPYKYIRRIRTRFYCSLARIHRSVVVVSCGTWFSCHSVLSFISIANPASPIRTASAICLFMASCRYTPVTFIR